MKIICACRASLCDISLKAYKAVPQTTTVSNYVSQLHDSSLAYLHDSDHSQLIRIISCPTVTINSLCQIVIHQAILVNNNLA